MLKAISVSDKIWWVGVNDRKTPLFENLWSLPYGVSYNSYLIDDEKVALIDGVKAEFFGEYLERIQSIIGARPVDYLIVNHVEPDHSSAIRMLRQVYPNIAVVADKQALAFIGQFYGPSVNAKEVKDGETLTLGARSLTFATIPMVHWPETMISFENSSGIAFTCDAFGSYGALNGGIFGDELDMHVYTGEARRYYATIVGRFSVNVQAALKKAAALPIKMICPSHGPVHRGEGVEKIVRLYDGMSRQETTQSAVIVYGSMYGNTARMAECVADGLCGGGHAFEEAVLVADEFGSPEAGDVELLHLAAGVDVGFAVGAAAADGEVLEGSAVAAHGVAFEVVEGNHKVVVGHVSAYDVVLDVRLVFHGNAYLVVFVHDIYREILCESVTLDYLPMVG